MKPARALLALTALAACADDAAQPIDAAVDAAIDGRVIDGPDVDAGPCGADFFLTGAYEDWDSTTAAFDGVEFATWTVRGEPARTFTTNPNGRVELCIGRGNVSVIDATQTDYRAAIYVTQPEVFAPPGLFFFQIKGIKNSRFASFFAELAVTPDPARGHVLVQEMGTPRPLTLTGGGVPFAVENSDDLTWSAGATGGLVLFTNVATGTSTLSTTGAIVGPTSLPVEAGKLTIVTVR